MTTDEANVFWAQLLLEELRRQGVNYFILCPGFRSSPLALALAAEDRVDKIVHCDERGAAYHAIGYAWATGRPAAVITTSGTAAANLFPAVVEASTDHLPLIVITADRPPEARHCGAHQTIDQVKIFGDYVRFFADLPCPDAAVDPAFLVSTADQAVSRALCRPAGPGPVHLNCMYREPLVPDPKALVRLDKLIPERFGRLQNWLSAEAPHTTRDSPASEPSADTLDPVLKIVNRTERGLLLLGRLDSEPEQLAALELGRQLGWPVLADVTSGVSTVSELHLVNHFDLILASERFQAAHHPDTILHIGGRFISGRLLRFIEASRPRHYILNCQNSQLVDPLHAVTLSLNSDNALFCRALADRLAQNQRDSNWRQGWSSASDAAGRVVEKMCRHTDELTEPSLANTLSQCLDPGAALFLSSSMPIRDLNMFGAAAAGAFPVASNRGTSGIDGTIASACGYAVGRLKPVTLLIGDQAFLHDLNSLIMLSRIDIPVIVVVINNNGGRLFEQLPIFKHSGIVEPLFVAPHNLTFEKIAQAFRIAYAPAGNIRSFVTAFTAARKADASTIIEAIIDPARSREHRERVLEAVKSAMDQL